MGELGNRFGLPLQAHFQRRIGGKAGRQNLDRNRAVEPRIVRAIDFAHAASAEGSKDLVRAEFVACRERHMSGVNKCTRSKSGLCLDYRHPGSYTRDGVSTTLAT